jgi:peptide/nickel transport system ATP-binding protein
LPQQNKPGHRLNQIRGSMPTLDNIPKGCSFSPRCDFADDQCIDQSPALPRENGHQAACHHIGSLLASVEKGDA